MHFPSCGKTIPILAACLLSLTQPVFAQSPAPVKVDLGTGAILELVRIEPGSFEMGRPETERGESDETLHPVTLTKPFYIGKYLVTQEQWSRIMGTNPSKHQDPKCPVDSVTWKDCQEFLKRLNGKVAGPHFRLPTEAEWEYACRAGTKTKWFFGEDEAKAVDYMWSQTNSANISHPVGEKLPNPWGLMDMSGNLLEWCQDYYGKYQIDPNHPAVDPVQTQGIYRILRGGSFSLEARHGRSARRFCYPPDETNSSFGFRVARDAE
jgi:formylglycine-generating enzyme required for sulfatase activity